MIIVFVGLHLLPAVCNYFNTSTEPTILLSSGLWFPETIVVTELMEFLLIFFQMMDKIKCLEVEFKKICDLRLDS